MERALSLGRNNAGSCGVEAIMGEAGLSLLLLLTVPFTGAMSWAPQQLNSGISRSQHIKLEASIESGTKHVSSLRVSLRNTDLVPVTILTGTIAGGTPFPEASFHFEIILSDHSQSELWCTTCGPTVIAGSVGPFTITLAPNGVFHFEIPLADFRIIGAKHDRLCALETVGARIVVVLQGKQFNAANSTNHEVYWTGRASDSVLLSCS